MEKPSLIPSAPSTARLFPIALSGPEQIDTALSALQERNDRSSSLIATLSDCWNDYRALPQSPISLALVAGSPDDLSREIRTCRQTWSKCWAAGQDWKTPAGSYLSPQPAGSSGKVAFVFPGIGSLYPGYSRELLSLFPQSLDGLPVSRDELLSMLHREHLWPMERGPGGPNLTDAADDWPLYRDIVAQAEATVSLAYVWTHLLQQTFGLRPGMALGYSLGEVAMFAACGCWRQPQELSARFREWPSFRERLSGRMTILSDSPLTRHIAAEEWIGCLAQVPGSIPSERGSANSPVYFTHVNTARELVVAGAGRDVNAWLTRNGVRGQPLPSRLIYHCEPVSTEADTLQTLFELPVASRPAIDFVAMQPYGRVPHDPKSIAATLVNTARHTVEWPQIVTAAHRRGARVFVEIGPRNSCSSWIQSILAGQPHVTASTDRKGFDVASSLTRLFAVLLSHRVPLSSEAVAAWTQRGTNTVP